MTTRAGVEAGASGMVTAGVVRIRIAATNACVSAAGSASNSSRARWTKFS